MKFREATLVIVGAPLFNREHEYLQLLKQTALELGIAERVRMPGARSDVAAIMQALDLLVINSSVEAFCLVALEAMACGTPILAAVSGGIPELIEHGKNGWLLPRRDEQTLAAAILDLSRQPALCAQLAEQGKKHIDSRFCADRYVAELQAFYHSNSHLKSTTDKDATAERVEDAKVRLSVSEREIFFEMGDPFILQVSREIGLRGGSECVAFELHRAWLALGIDARAVTSHATEPEARQGITFAASWLKRWGPQARARHLALAHFSAVVHAGRDLARVPKPRSEDCLEPRRFADRRCLRGARREQCGAGREATHGILRLASESQQSVGGVARLVDAPRRTLSKNSGNLRTRAPAVEAVLSRP